MPTATIKGNLQECGIFIVKIPTDKGFINTVNMKSLSVTPTGAKFHKLSRLTRSKRFSIIDTYYQNLGGKEILVGDLIDTKLKAHFGISANNEKLMIVPRQAFNIQAAEEFTKFVARIFRIDVVVSPGEEAKGDDVSNTIRHPELLLEL
ncbi:MAG: hypothetical protein JRN68_03285 [Nitrososphaerota archaeon]|nr:hypothetical protein [Nitrososphaerota archaeon]